MRLAARSVGLKYGTVQHRRRVHPGFAAAVGAAIVFAQAALAKKQAKGPLHRKRPPPPEIRGGSWALSHRWRRGDHRPAEVGQAAGAGGAGGEVDGGRGAGVLCALAATCNIALAAAAVGAAPNAFARRRKRDPAFAREILLAVAQGYETLDLALLAGLEPYADPDWRGGEPPPMPPMSVDQVLQLMRVHQKEARLLAEVEKWEGGGGPSTKTGR